MLVIAHELSFQTVCAKPALTYMEKLKVSKFEPLGKAAIRGGSLEKETVNTKEMFWQPHKKTTC